MADFVERRSGRYGQVHYVCEPCHAEASVVFPSPDRHDCPNRPEYSLCPQGHQMRRLTPQQVAERSLRAMRGLDPEPLDPPGAC